MRFPFTGVIPVDKPVGVSSRHVVDVVARALGMKSVGHAGTLDPLASGVVIVCVGHATKLVDYLHDLTKHYAATFLLGRSSPSDDLETPVEEEEQPVRASAAEIEAAAIAFRGDILQRPCDYSAVHVDGKRAYRLARKGRPVVLESKPVRIHRLTITGYEWPRLAVEIECSSGTFVRALGRDLAESLGTKAVMESLVRTAVGPFSCVASISLVPPWRICRAWCSLTMRWRAPSAEGCCSFLRTTLLPSPPSTPQVNSSASSSSSSRAATDYGRIFSARGEGLALDGLQLCIRMYTILVVQPA